MSAADLETRLAAVGLSLPEAAAPAANYLPFVRSGTALFVSGQISQWEGELIRGKLGQGMTADEGAASAQSCALYLLAQVKAALKGDFGRLKRVVKLTGFVNSAPDFRDHPKVINGASDLLVALLGEDVGAHARSAVGVAALPLGVAVEIEGVFEVE